MNSHHRRLLQIKAQLQTEVGSQPDSPSAPVIDQAIDLLRRDAAGFTPHEQRINAAFLAQHTNSESSQAKALAELWSKAAVEEFKNSHGRAARSRVFGAVHAESMLPETSPIIRLAATGVLFELNVLKVTEATKTGIAAVADVAKTIGGSAAAQLRRLPRRAQPGAKADHDQV